MSTVELKTFSHEAGDSAKKLRKEHFIPGVVYGSSIESEKIKVGYNTAIKFLSDYPASFNLKINKKKLMATVREIQVDPKTGKVIHLSFQAFSDTDRVTLSIPIVIKGEEDGPGVQEGGQIFNPLDSIELLGQVNDMPDEFVVDVSEFNIGDIVYVEDLKLSDKYDVRDPLDRLVVTCTAPVEEEEETTEAPEDESPDAKLEEQAEGEEEADSAEDKE